MNKVYTFLAFILLPINLLCQQTFRTVHDEVFLHSEVYEKSDGSFIFIGSTYTETDFVPFDWGFPFITNLDSTGEIISTHLYADIEQEPIFLFYYHDLILTASNYIYSTVSLRKDNDQEVSGIMKIDALGNPVWFRELSTSNFTTSRSYLLVENLQTDILSFAQRNGAMGISKLDVSGNLVSDVQICLDVLTGIFDGVFAHTDKVVDENGFIYLSGSMSVETFSENTGFIHKVNSKGVTSAVWTIQNFTPFNIEQNSDGDLILIGNTLINGIFFPAIVKMDTSGNIIEAHYIPIELDAKKYAGGTLTSSDEVNVIVQQLLYPYTTIFKFSDNLEILFAKVYPGGGHSSDPKVTVIEDGGIIFSSRVKVEGTQSYKTVITKLDEQGDFTGLEVKEICLDDPIPFELQLTNQSFTVIDVFAVNSEANFSKIPYIHTPAELDPIAFPSPYFNLPDELCIDQCSGPTELENENADSWEWFIEGADTENYSIPNPGQACWSEAGTYTVRQIISFQNCLDTFEQIINIYPEIESLLSDTVSFCPDELPLLVGETEFVNSYLWSTGETTANILAEQEGLYILDLSNAECNQTDSIYVNLGEDNLNNISLIQLPDDTILCQQNFPFLIPLDTSFVTAGNWENGSTENQRRVNQAGFFTFSTEIDGCSFSETIEIKSKHCDIVYLPNAFSPNNDGINDIFRPEGIYFQSQNLRIYDRWGNLLFSERGESLEWNGELNGQKLGTGNFVYVFEYLNLLTNEKEVVSGDLLLLK